MIRYKAQVEIDLNAQDWQLYSNTEGAETAAQKMSEGLSLAINEAWDMVEKGHKYSEGFDHIWNKHNKTANEFASFGATDSEPDQMFFNIVNHLFNKNLVDYVAKQKMDIDNTKKMKI